MIPQSELIIEFGIGVEEKDRNESLSQKTEFKGKQSTVQYLFFVSDASAAESATPSHRQCCLWKVLS